MSKRKPSTPRQRFTEAVKKAKKDNTKKAAQTREREARRKAALSPQKWKGSQAFKRYKHAEAQRKYRNGQKVSKTLTEYLTAAPADAKKFLNIASIGRQVGNKSYPGYWMVRDFMRELNSIPGNKIFVMQDINGGTTATTYTGAGELNSQQATYARRNLRRAESHINATPKGKRKNYLPPKAVQLDIFGTRIFFIDFQTDK